MISEFLCLNEFCLSSLLPFRKNIFSCHLYRESVLLTVPSRVHFFAKCLLFLPNFQKYHQVIFHNSLHYSVEHLNRIQAPTVNMLQKGSCFRIPSFQYLGSFSAIPVRSTIQQPIQQQFWSTFSLYFQKSQSINFKQFFWGKSSIQFALQSPYL